MTQFLREHSRVLNLAVKIILVVAFGWFVSQRLTEQGDISAIWHAFLAKLETGPMWALMLALILMPCNWLMETLKWKTLMRPVHLSWRRTVAAILSGVTLSLFTPNRTGEYGGRILYVQSGDRWRAVLASVTGSFAQNMVYIALGLVAGMVFLSRAHAIPSFTERGIWILVPVIICVLVGIYFHLPSIASALSSRRPPRFLRKLWDALQHLSGMPRKYLTQALGFSAARYGIFVFQYVLLLHFFGVDVSWTWLVAGVAVMYLIQTSVPLPPVLDLVARNEVGIVLWAGMGANELSVVAAGLTIWTINLAIPALFGLLAISAVNVPGIFEYDQTIRPANAPQHVPGPVHGHGRTS